MSKKSGTSRLPTGGIELMRRLLRWTARQEPLVWLEPFPPPNDYGRLRPQDRRDVPTMELLPMVSEQSVLAIIFLYAPVAFETALHLCPPPNIRVKSAHDLWNNRDLTDQIITGGRAIQIPLRVSAHTELLAIRADFRS
jgi:hypothetical protein